MGAFPARNGLKPILFDRSELSLLSAFFLFDDSTPSRAILPVLSALHLQDGEEMNEQLRSYEGIFGAFPSSRCGSFQSTTRSFHTETLFPLAIFGNTMHNTPMPALLSQYADWSPNTKVLLLFLQSPPKALKDKMHAIPASRRCLYLWISSLVRPRSVDVPKTFFSSPIARFSPPAHQSRKSGALFSIESGNPPDFSTSSLTTVPPHILYQIHEAL